MNLNGMGGIYRSVALPVFDETQWDHVLGGARAPSMMSADDRNARDVGLHVLTQAGVDVDSVPMEEHHNDAGWLPKPGKPNREFVHTLFGLQTKLPYFADANDADDEAKSREALLKAGVHMGPVSWDGAAHNVEG